MGGIQPLIQWMNCKSSMSPTEMEAAAAVRTSGPPVVCANPGHTAASQFRARFVHGQHELCETSSTDPRKAAPKRPYSPTSEECSVPALEECPKKRVHKEKVRRGARPMRG